MRHSIATLFLALDGQTSADLASNLTRRNVKAFTIITGLGVWEGQREPYYTVTIVGLTEAPAHLASNPYDPGLPAVLMPADPTAFESAIRTLAENLAIDFRQDCVAFSIVPCLFELTTPQATYQRYS